MKLNKYQQQAENFLIKASANINIELAEQQQAPLWFDGVQDYGLMYKITIHRTNKKDYKFNFWDSLHNKQMRELVNKIQPFADGVFNGKYYDKQEALKIARDLKKGLYTPTSYDILACLTKYDPETFEDFCSEYGYSEDSRTAEKTFLAVNKEYHEVKRMFVDLMEDLQEIN